jgi:hypothetical protein
VAAPFLGVVQISAGRHIMAKKTTKKLGKTKNLGIVTTPGRSANHNDVILRG